MRKKSLCVLFLIFVSLYAFPAFSEVAINSANFPDDTFRSIISEKADVNHDGILSDSEISAVTSLDISSQEIYIVKGLENFTALTELNCSNNQICLIDVSNFRNLQRMDCSNNNIVTLDISENNALTYLNCSSNLISFNLDLSNNANLEYLLCSDNIITHLYNLKNCKNLLMLDCSQNSLYELDLSENTNLLWLNYKEQKPVLEFKYSNGVFITDLKNYITDFSKFVTTSSDIYAYAQKFGEGGEVFVDVTLHDDYTITAPEVPATLVYRYDTGLYIYDLVMEMQASTTYTGTIPDDPNTIPKTSGLHSKGGGCNSGFASLILFVPAIFITIRKKYNA